MVKPERATSDESIAEQMSNIYTRVCLQTLKPHPQPPLRTGQGERSRGEVEQNKRKSSLQTRSSTILHHVAKRESRTMRKLVVSMFLSLDGVMENPGWTMPYWNDEIAQFKADESVASDALLLGRVTYGGFAAAWPNSTDDGANQMNSIVK